MDGIKVGELLLSLSLIFALTGLFGYLLSRFRIPGILAALFVGMILSHTPFFQYVHSTTLFKDTFEFLADLGVLFLLFYIGLQIELGEMKKSSSNIIWLTILNTTIPFLFGLIAMLLYGYGWAISLIIGMTRMPTAEAVIVPILDEFNMIKTKVGTYIIGAGVLDDIIEVILVGIVSIWIGAKIGQQGGISGLLVGIILFMLISWAFYKWLPRLTKIWRPESLSSLMVLSLVILFGFGGFGEYVELGMVVGAITAGVIMRPMFENEEKKGELLSSTAQTLSYGFFGISFFFWVGFNADIEKFWQEPLLAIILYLAGTLGKLIGVLIMVPMKKMRFKEAVIVGIGLDARLTTEIIVAQLLYSSAIINLKLFTALVAASSFTAMTVPLIFSLLIRYWGDEVKYET
ncbi:cation:proton antiporter [Sulfurimonas sp.]|uniref:cation:proton antiporter n=1 Tax=Sulfurimonas sp. TaxID=2022749 RepID=UPI003562BEDB